MAGCSLTEAFPDVTENSGKVKKEVKKTSSRQGPALSFLKADPDRAERPEEPPKPLTSGNWSEGSNLPGDKVNDVIGERTPKESSESFKNKVPSYFGKSDDFADFNPSLTDNPGYQIQGAGFGSFDKKGLEKAAGQQLLPTPVLNDVWKPLTPSGAQTSFFDTKDDSFSKSEKAALLNKLDVLFARLDDLEHKKNDYAHTEISLFILSGLFLLFGLETVRKFR